MDRMSKGMTELHKYLGSYLISVSHAIFSVIKTR